MTSERWGRVKDVFHEALARAPEARAAFLGDVCAGDAELRAEVERLLVAHAKAGSFIEQSPVRPPATTAPRRELTGQTIGHYEVKRRIGAGGMGEVYEARDTTLGRIVAIKVVTSGDAEAQLRLRREAQHASQLNHPHICTIHEVGETEGQAYVVMEYVEGQPLTDLITGDGLPAETVVRYGIQMADALAHAHQHDLIHRDLKSANVVITPDSRAKVLDFGLARRLVAGELDRLTRSEASVTAGAAITGTLAYMAPELLRGEPADVRTDIWALGVVLYEMVTGRQPFTGSTGFELSSAIFNAKPVSPGTTNRRVSPGLEHVILSCLEKEPARRYQTASKVHTDLQRLSAGIALSAVTRRRFARRLAVAASVVLLGVLLWQGRSLGGLFEPAVDPQRLLVLPMQIRGQVEGSDYAGRAFAESLAVHLARARTLNVLPVPEAGELAAGGPLTHIAEARQLQAGLMLSGSLRREGEALYASLSLVDTSRTRVVWGTESSDPEGSLSALAASLAREVAAEMGVTFPRLYEYYLYDSGSPALAASPDMTEALSAVRRFDVDRGLAATRRLIEEFPNEPQAYVLRGCALLKEAWLTWPAFPQRKAFEEAMRTLNRLDPNSPWDEYLNALVLLNEGNLREAIDAYDKLLARADLSAAARGDITSFRAWARAWQGDLTNALREFEEALRLDPTSELTFMNFSDALYFADRKDEALTRARQAVALNPTWHLTNVNLAWHLSHVQRWQEASEPAKKACEATRGQFECGLHAVVLLRAGRAQEAAAASHQASLLPESDWGALVLAGYHAVAGSHREALRLLRRYVQLTPIVVAGHVIVVSKNENFAPLRGDPAFEAILAEMRERAASAASLRQH